MSLVSHRDLNVDNINVTPPQPKQFTGDNGSGTYHSSEIKYKFDSGKDDKFKVELCEVTCSPIYKSGDKKDDKQKNQPNQLQTNTQETPKKKKKMDKFYVKMELDIMGETDVVKNLNSEQVAAKIAEALDCANKMDQAHVKFAELFMQYKIKFSTDQK